MNVRATTMAATLAALALAGVAAVQAQDASPAPEGSPAAESPGMAAESPGLAAESPAAVASPAAESPAAVGSPAAGGETTGDGPHPAHIHVGSCPEVGDVVEGLSDVTQPTAEMVEGAEQVPLELSTTMVPLALQDILAGEHAINVHESAEALEVYIACGDIGMELTGEDSVAIVLEELNESGHSGFAWLTDQGDGSTRVDVILTAAEADMAAGTDTGAEASPAAGTDTGTEASPAAGTDTGTEASPAADMSPAPEESPAA